MARQQFVAIITDSSGKVVGGISAEKYDSDKGELKRQWGAFLQWRKEAESRTVLTDKETRAMGLDLAEAFGQFLFMQDGKGGSWSYSTFRDSIKSILVFKEK